MNNSKKKIEKYLKVEEKKIRNVHLNRRAVILLRHNASQKLRRMYCLLRTFNWISREKKLATINNNELGQKQNWQKFY